MTMIRTGLVFAAALFAAVFQTSAAPDVEIADVSVMAGGVEFVVRGNGAMFVRESDGKLVRLLDFNLGVGLRFTLR